MFSWVNEMMKKGNHQTLNDDDLLELPNESRAKNALALYRLQKTASMALNLLASFKSPLFAQFWYCMGWSILMFGPPLFLNKIIKFIENGDESVSSAFIYVLGLFLTSCGQSLAYQQALYIGRTLGIRIQSIVIGEVYSKSLRRRDESGGSAAAAGGDQIGLSAKSKVNVNNLLSVDAQKMGELTAYVFYIYCFPVQITICIWSLYKLLGNASLWGVFVMCISQPVTYWLSRRFQKLQHAAMACTDKRIGLMNELLNAIRIIKFFAWEKQFRQRVLDSRDAELKVIRSRLYMFMWIGSTWFLIPVLIMVAVFYAYTREYVLTASTAFTALALFNNFKTTLDELPVITSFILQANVSLGRIGKFLQEDEVKLPAPNNTSSTHIGFVDNASFSWNEGKDAVPHVKNLNVSFPLNKLSIVCGPTGSGKTTLLSSLLGETHCLSGSAVLPRKPYNKSEGLGGAVSGIAYVAQTAWLQNASIRDNILFGLPYDQERYENILYMTALTRDLEILEFGDSTEVGEKGITLSGGQKQRVAIARAVYSQADIVILDDCLSAVDAHTAKHLYEHCLLGEYMRNRTVILVTHHVSLCIRGSGYVVALNESGSVSAAGKPFDVIKTGVLGEVLSQEGWMEKIDAKEEAATNGPIPTIPRMNKNKANAADGAGKLVQEEKRAEGGVSWQVYATYYYASGGFFFWFSVLLFFCAAQASILGQDYWIKVWSSAYGSANDIAAQVMNVASGNYNGSRSDVLVNTLFSYNNMVPQSIKAFATELKDGESVDVAYYLGIYFLIGMISLALTMLRSLFLFYGTLKASRSIHSQLLDRILRAKVRFFDTTPVGRIVNRFSSDLETIDQAVGPSLSFLLYSIVATVYVIILISIITPAFIIPGVFIAMMFRSVGAYYLNTSRDMKRLNSVSRSPIYVQFNETVVGVATIRAFGAQRRFIKENFKRIDTNNRPFIWMWATNRWLHCRVDVLGAFVSFCTGVVLVLSKDVVNAGLAGLSLSYALTFTHHVLWVVRMYAINEMNMNAIERVHEYLDIDEEPPAHIAGATLRQSWPESGTVQVKNLVMKYAPDTPAVLRNVSFQTRPREKIGVVGRTGSGKSTLALSLFRFMEPAEGSVLIDGVDIHKIGLDDLRSRLTIIPQDPVLFSGTLRSNLDPFNQYQDAELWAALKRSHLIDHQLENSASNNSVKSSNSSTVETITLDSPVTENGNNWSQGQRQLIALARALVKKTSLIILDEATSSVDFDTDHQIQETIRNEFKDSSLLCIAHRIRTVADYDRILVLDHGQVKEFDTPYELMTRDGSIFQQMCERSGEFPELLAIAKAKFDADHQQN
jgi:ABC-type multidrug transport system fused ATPase/permease subunit